MSAAKEMNEALRKGNEEFYKWLAEKMDRLDRLEQVTRGLIASTVPILGIEYMQSLLDHIAVTKTTKESV